MIKRGKGIDKVSYHRVGYGNLLSDLSRVNKMLLMLLVLCGWIDVSDGDVTLIVLHPSVVEKWASVWSSTVVRSQLGGLGTLTLVLQPTTKLFSKKKASQETDKEDATAEYGSKFQMDPVRSSRSASAMVDFGSWLDGNFPRGGMTSFDWHECIEWRNNEFRLNKSRPVVSNHHSWYHGDT